MNLFLDTSALVKLFHEEEGSGVVTAWIKDPSNEIWMLDLARLEFTSALYRRFRSQEINEEKLKIALGASSS